MKICATGTATYLGVTSQGAATYGSLRNYILLEAEVRYRLCLKPQLHVSERGEQSACVPVRSVIDNIYSCKTRVKICATGTGYGDSILFGRDFAGSGYLR